MESPDINDLKKNWVTNTIQDFTNDRKTLKKSLTWSCSMERSMNSWTIPLEQQVAKTTTTTVTGYNEESYRNQGGTLWGPDDSNDRCAWNRRRDVRDKVWYKMNEKILTTIQFSDTEDTCNHSMLYLKMNLVKVKDARQDTITTITLHANTKEKMTWQGLIKTASNKILTTTQIRGTEDTCKSPSKINLETVKCLQREVITS
jgi:hypothetical protein